jgi:hypothetical protein
MNKIGYTGKIDNWMDFKDKLLEILSGCDNETKFNRFIEGIILSFGVSTKNINEARKSIGCEPLTKEEKEKMDKFFKDDEDKEIAKEIFEEIDSIISQCKSDKPVPFEDSKFRKLYKKLKEKYGIKEEKENGSS